MNFFTRVIQKIDRVASSSKITLSYAENEENYHYLNPQNLKKSFRAVQ